MKVFFLLALVPFVYGTGQLLGGYEDADKNDPSLKEIAEFGLKKINDKENSARRLVEIVSVKTQVVAGINYALVLHVNNGDKNEICNVTVYVSLDNVRTLTKDKCETAKPAEPVKPPMLGGKKTATEKDVMEAVKVATDYHNLRSNSVYREEVVNIENIHEQTVAGKLYTFTVNYKPTNCLNERPSKKTTFEKCSLNSAGNLNKCTFSVLYHSWLKPKYEVKSEKCEPQAEPDTNVKNLHNTPTLDELMLPNEMHPDLTAQKADAHTKRKLHDRPHLNELLLPGQMLPGLTEQQKQLSNHISPLLKRQKKSVDVLQPLMQHIGQSVYESLKNAKKEYPEEANKEESDLNKLLGKDGHDLIQRGFDQLLGGDGHDLLKHGIEKLLGGDDHDFKGHGLDQLLGGDNNDFVKHAFGQLLGGDDHDLQKHGGLIGGDDHDKKKHGGLIGGDDHDMKKHGGLIGGDDHDMKKHGGLIGGDDHDKKKHGGLIGADDHDMKKHGGLIGGDDHDMKRHGGLIGGDDHDMKRHGGLIGGDDHDMKRHGGLIGGDDHDMKRHGGLIGGDDHDMKRHGGLIGGDDHDMKRHGGLIGGDDHDMKRHGGLIGGDDHDMKRHGGLIGGDDHDMKRHGGLIGGDDHDRKRQPGGDDHYLCHPGHFKEFTIKHGKTYNSVDEEKKRFAIFCDNMAFARELNQSERGTAVYGPTQFADLTQEEFKQKYLSKKNWADITNYGAARMWRAKIPNGGRPKSFDWRDHGAVTEVKNQGQCGSCWAFSTTGNIEGQWKIKRGKLVSLSEQELVDCDKLDEGCNGGLPSNAYQSILKLGGLETEGEYKYRGEDEKCFFNKSEVAVTINGAVNISSNEDDMASWLAENGPISIGINANAMQFYFGGISHPWKIFCNPSNLDHGVLIVGYGVEGSTPYWIIKNSWGPSWGEKGYYRVYRGGGVCGLNTMCTSAVVN